MVAILENPDIVIPITSDYLYGYITIRRWSKKATHTEKYGSQSHRSKSAGFTVAQDSGTADINEERVARATLTERFAAQSYRSKGQ